MYIDDLLRLRNFKKINEMLKNGELALKELIDIDDADSIEVLAENLHRLENVNLDDLVNAFSGASADIIVSFALYATCLSETHIQTLADFVIKTGDIDSMIEFASISNAPIDKLGKKIKELNDIEKIIEFLEKVPNISNELMDDFARIIATTKDINVISNFLETSKKIYASTYEILVSGLITINDASKMMGFIKNAKNCHQIIPKDTLKTLLNSIITLLKEEKTELNNFGDIYQYIIENYPNEIQTEIFEDLTDKVILTQKIDFIANFGINFEGANKAKIAKTLVESNSFKWVYIFAKNAKNIPDGVMNILIEFVRKTFSPEFIYLFLCNFVLSRINLFTLVFAIMKTDNIGYIGFALINIGNKYLQGDLKTEERMGEIMNAKRILKDYLDKTANYSFLTHPISNPCDELEKKLLNSDDKVQNPFLPTEDAKQRIT